MSGAVTSRLSQFQLQLFRLGGPQTEILTKTDAVLKTGQSTAETRAAGRNKRESVFPTHLEGKAA